MRKRRAFILNSTVILLLIPLMLLLATYEDVSSQIILSQSERTQVERTYRIVSYVEMDFQRALEISGKRAIVTIVDYIANTRDFLDPDDPNGMANATIRDLTLFGSSTQIASNYSERLMRDQTILGWLGNISTKLETQGYVLKIGNHTLEEITSMDPTTKANFLRNHVRLTVAPLDAFRIVIKARILEAEIEEVSGKILYAGPIPRDGYVYSIISVENLEDPLFSALSFGRYYRSIKACEYPYPEIMDRPLKVLYGNGSSEEDHVLGKYSSSQVSEGYIFYGDYYPGSGADGYVLSGGDITGISDPIIVNTTLRGVPVSPLDVFSDNDIGVLVFGNTSVETHWCDMNYKWRVNITIPSFPDGSAVLLKIPVSLFPNIYHEEGRASLKIYQKSEESCTQVPFWIEYWGTSYAWIWIQTQGEDYTVYFTDDPGYAIDGYRKEDIFWLIDTFDGPDIDLIKWENLADAYLDGNGHLIVPGGTKKLVLQTRETIDGPFFVRFRMAPDSTAKDFDAGIQITPTPSSSEGYLQVTVNYPSNVQDVQIPVYLNSTTAQMILHNELGEAQIEVYSDPEMTSSLPFWIEYWNDSGALIWIRGDLPGTFYIKYNTGTYRRGNGNAVFPFFDDFNETLSKWIIDPYGQGAEASIDTTGNGTVTIDGGNSIFAMLTAVSLNINYKFAVRFRMKPNFERWRDWDAGIGLRDQYVAGGTLAPVLFTDDITADYLAQHRAWWNYETSSDSGRGDYTFHTYEVSMYDYYYSYYYDAYIGEFMFEDLTATDRTPTTDWWYFLMPLEGLYLVIDSENEDRGATYDWIFVRKLIDDGELSYDITDHPTTYDLQFIDDNAGFEDHGGDTLAILENWGASKVSGTPTTLAEYHRYEVRLTSSGGTTELEFEDVDTAFRTVSSNVDGDILENVKVGVSTDGSTEAYFDWIIIGELPYYSAEGSDIQSSGVESAPSESVSPYNARAYDLQPLISCIIDQKYFGTYGGISFFERLEDSRKNHAEYFELAKQIQDELGMKYGDRYYPIGLVSFMVPHADYDRKLFNIFDNFGIPIKEGQNSVDYYFLHYYFAGGSMSQGYRVWGISYGVSTLTGDLSVVPFFIDNQTAVAILGATGAQDLLQG